MKSRKNLILGRSPDNIQCHCLHVHTHRQIYIIFYSIATNDSYSITFSTLFRKHWLHFWLLMPWKLEARTQTQGKIILVRLQLWEFCVMTSCCIVSSAASILPSTCWVSRLHSNARFYNVDKIRNHWNLKFWFKSNWYLNWYLKWDCELVAPDEQSEWTCRALLMSQHKWVRPQHWTGSLYGGSLQGVDWPTQLFRHQLVLGLWHRARGTSTWVALGDWTETNTVLQLFYLQTSLKTVTMFHR